MKVTALSGMWWAADYLYGKKPLPRKEDQHPTGSFKEILDQKMTQIGGKTCGKNSESLIQQRR